MANGRTSELLESGAMNDRYTEVLTQVLSFAGEAAIRAEGGEPGFVAWRRLSERLYDAAVLADRDAISKPMCVEADRRAVEAVAADESMREASG